MNIAFSEEQEELRRSVRRFLEVKSPEGEVRRLMETPEGFDRAVWAQMAGQLGLQGLHIPEEYGGSGYSQVELIVVFEEMGRALLAAPYFSSVALAANTLVTSGDEGAKKELLPSIASGEHVATLALTEEGGGWDPQGVTVGATAVGGEYRLDGRKTFVTDGLTAELILVVARASGTGSGVSLFAVDGSASGLSRTPLVTLDQTRKQARLDFSATPARLVGVDGGAGAGLSKALDLAAVALAAEQVGGAQACLDMSVSYAGQRVQFGRPIGSFQAVKHTCANVLVETEAARSAAYYAARVADDDDGLALAAPLAQSYCSVAFLHAAAANIQVHGGVGFTWEHPAHLWFRRAKSSQLLLGPPAYHRELLASRIPT